MKKLDMSKFKKLNPCKDGYEFVLGLKTDDLSIIFDKLKDHRLDWANWLVARLLDNNNKVRYAIFAAEQVIHIFEGKYPEDSRPRRAIEAAQDYLSRRTDAAADDAADAARAAYTAARTADAAAAAADDAADAARAAYTAARAAADAARAAARAAYTAARTADAAVDYAAYAAYAACDAADVADVEAAEMKTRIIDYGIALLDEQEDSEI